MQQFYGYFAAGSPRKSHFRKERLFGQIGRGVSYNPVFFANCMCPLSDLSTIRPNEEKGFPLAFSRLATTHSHNIPRSLSYWPNGRPAYTVPVGAGLAVNMDATEDGRQCPGAEDGQR